MTCAGRAAYTRQPVAGRLAKGRGVVWARLASAGHRWFGRRKPAPEKRPARRLTAFEVFLHVREKMRSQTPASVIRLGDGEGALLGYPTMTNRQDVDRSLLIWLRTKAVDEPDVLSLVDALKHAVANADIVGLPRGKQIEQEGFHLWRAVQQSVDALGLLSPAVLETHTALHRLLQHALLYRPILKDSPFLGIISCRPIAAPLRELFNIGEVRWHGVRGELDATGPVEQPHYPDGFHELKHTLTVPFRGALFLVGAGAFGKVYCQWIKERGGIAIDIGSIFDAWANVGRVGEPVRSLDVYRAMPNIARHEAITRYNSLADELGLDVPRADVNAGYVRALPEAW